MNRTISRAFEALTLLGNNPDGLSLKEITEALQIPKSSAFDIIQSLLELRVATTSKYNEKKYVLGSNIYSLGMKYVSNMSLTSVYEENLNPLADELHRNAFVAILDDTDVVYIYKYAGKGAKLATCNVGTRLDLYSTALGKVLLANADEDVRNDIISRIEFVKHTTNTIKSQEQLLAECKKVYEQGYAVDNREREYHMMCFAAPIYDNTQRVVAAISFSDIYSPNINQDEIVAKIKQCALNISKCLGYRSN